MWLFLLDETLPLGRGVRDEGGSKTQGTQKAPTLQKLPRITEVQSCWGKRWLPWIMGFPDTAFLRHRGEVLGVIAALVTHTSVSNAHKLIGSPSWTWMESFLQSVPCLGGIGVYSVSPGKAV